MVDFGFLGPVIDRFAPLNDVLRQKIGGGNSLIDGWFFVHFLAGYVLGKLTRSRVLTLVILIGFEFFEAQLIAQGLVFGERLADTVLDIVIGFVGAEVARLF